MLQLSASSVIALQGGTPAAVNVTVTRPAGTSRPVNLSVVSLPPGVTAQVESPGTGETGKLTFTSQSATAGTYKVTVAASDGVSSGSADLSLIIGIVATVGTQVQNVLTTSMSTSFQPADWDFKFFNQNPQATGPLDALQSQHIRLQAVDGGVPQKTPTSWDFSELDAIVNPVLSVADHSPEFQIAVAPSFMLDAQGHFLDSTYSDFANYCVNLVKYYNQGGFTDAQGVHHASSSPFHITWWGIFNEPNINALTPDQYTRMYNVVVPAMQAADPTLKFVAVELADFGSEPQKFLPTFVSQVAVQVDAVATHYYATCNQKDTDHELFNAVSQFTNHVNFIATTLRTNPRLASVPIWVTENNVNADFNKGGGISACNGTPFVLDLRGTSAYFAAWRPLVFSQLGQAGVRSLYHWDFNADAQFGEVNGQTAATFRSYWVDYWLERFFPAPPGSAVLRVSASESATVEILATRRSDGTLVVMIANHAVHASTDNNGPGDPRTVVVDLSAWSPFTSATLLTIDASTDPAQAPVPTSISPAQRIPITLNGYGVAFLTPR